MAKIEEHREMVMTCIEAGLSYEDIAILFDTTANIVARFVVPIRVDDHKDQIIGLAAEGKSGQEIADSIGVARETLCRHLRRWGVSTNAKRGRKNCLDANRDQVIGALQAGASVRSVARRYQVTPSGVRKALERWGLKVERSVALVVVEQASERLYASQNDSDPVERVSHRPDSPKALTSSKDEVTRWKADDPIERARYEAKVDLVWRDGVLVVS